MSPSYQKRDRERLSGKCDHLDLYQFLRIPRIINASIRDNKYKQTETIISIPSLRTKNVMHENIIWRGTVESWDL